MLAVVVDIKAKRKTQAEAPSYSRALIGVSILLCLSVCSNVASALSLLAVLSLPNTVPPAMPTHTPPSPSPLLHDGGGSVVSVPGLQKCATPLSGTEACWELADPAMMDIPDGFLMNNAGLTGTLKVGAAVKTIGIGAFLGTKLTGLDLSGATALVSIGESAFESTDLTSLDLSGAAKLEEIGFGAFFKTCLQHQAHNPIAP